MGTSRSLTVGVCFTATKRVSTLYCMHAHPTVSKQTMPTDRK